MTKEYSGCASNISFVQTNKGDMMPLIETILLYSEPVWRVDAGGSIIRSREMGSFRISAGPDALRDIAKYLVEYADDAEDILDRLTLSGSEV